MKTRLLILSAVAGALFLGGCASSGYVTDDVYYIPQDNANVQVAAHTTTGSKAAAQQPAEASGEDVFTAIDDYYRDNTYNEDTLQLSEEEANANGNGNVIINNYDGSYAARINHFFYPSMGFGYYDPFYYGGAYGPGLSFSMGFGFGYGYGYGYGYGGYPYYNPWYSPYYPYYSFYPTPYPYYPYYGGGCYYGCAGIPPIYSPDYGEYTPRYGHRNTVASNRLYSPSSGSVETAPVKSSFIPADSRRVSGTRRPESATTATTPRYRSTGGVATTRTGNNVSATPSTAKQATTRTTTYQPRRASQSSGSRVRTTRLPQSGTRAVNKTTTATRHRTSTAVNRTGRTYVPRYTHTNTTRTTARPTYNPSRNLGTTSRSRSVTTTKSYSPIIKRSSSTYTPRRSYTPSRSSYNINRSSSFSSPSISAPRSSSSTSRSSGSGGRRR